MTAFADDVATALPCDPAPVESYLGDSPAGQLLAQLEAVDGIAVGFPTLTHDPAGDVTGSFSLWSTDAESGTLVMVGYDEAVRDVLGPQTPLIPLGDGQAARVGSGALAFVCDDVPFGRRPPQRRQPRPSRREDRRRAPLHPVRPRHRLT